jgi:protein TonB
MPDTVGRQESIDTSAGHLSVHLGGRPDIQFQFARRPGRMGLAFLGSAALQAGILTLLILIGRIGLQKAGILPLNPQEKIDAVFIPDPGPGGGGGGGGNQMPDPPKKAEIRKPKTAEVTPVIEPPKIDPPPAPRFDMPVVTTLAQVEIPGAFQAPAGLSMSQGRGRGGGSGTGDGSGIGPGDGPGLGPGRGGNTGGGPVRPGNGVTIPTLVVETKPKYTPEAMRARVEGSAVVQCTVTKAGICTDIHVVQSLDPKYGLDQEAIDTVRQWRFRPGTREGLPVDVIVDIQVEFRLR